MLTLKNLLTHIIPPPTGSPEFLETLLTGAGLVVERIVSHGHTTPEGEWYDQARDEWVLVLEGHARLGYADGLEVELAHGSSLLIPKHVRHRVTYTSAPCVWLAIHAEELKMP